MNQIICSSRSNLNISDTSNSIQGRNIFRSKRNIFIILFAFFIIVCILAVFYNIYFRYSLYANEKVSKDILDNIGLTKIYQDDSDYNAKLLNKEIVFYENGSFSVIGVIDIKKLNISYPILSDVSKDFLKIAPCRFYGPMPNEIR